MAVAANLVFSSLAMPVFSADLSSLETELSTEMQGETETTVSVKETETETREETESQAETVNEMETETQAMTETDSETVTETEVQTETASQETEKETESTQEIEAQADVCFCCSGRRSRGDHRSEQRGDFQDYLSYGKSFRSTVLRNSSCRSAGCGRYL